MPIKPRRTKSLRSLQHDSNRTAPWDDEKQSKDNKSTNQDEVSDASPNQKLFTLPSGVSVRRFRRTDARCLRELFDSPGMDMGFPDQEFPQPFSLWRAHKLIDEYLDEDDEWRVQYPIPKDQDRAPADVMYDQASKAVTLRNLDERLNNLPQHIKAQSKSHDSDENRPAETLKKDKEEKTKVPRAYAIANDKDEVIGLVEIVIIEVATFDPDYKEHDNEPAFMHDSEIIYAISPKYSGQGIMTDVVREFCTWVWRTFPYLERISAGVYSSWNIASCKVLRKNNFILEGLIKDGVRKRGRWGDLDIYGLVRPGGVLEKRQDGVTSTSEAVNGLSI